VTQWDIEVLAAPFCLPLIQASRPPLRQLFQAVVFRNWRSGGNVYVTRSFGESYGQTSLRSQGMGLGLAPHSATEVFLLLN
jgi:hypothetical protein